MTVTGMNALTGRWLTGEAHLRRSVRDILLTPAGTRVMRRDYGSLLPALWRWEPRLTVHQIEVTGADEGVWMVTLHGQTTEGSRPFSFSVPLR